MADLVQSISDKLREETFTRTTIGNYTQNDIVELAKIIEQAHEQSCEKELQAICEDHLLHNKDSIISLYICGMMNLHSGTLDNSYLVSLVDIFQKNHKENIVAYLCEHILNDDPNNKFALRTLADNYHAEKNDKCWELYEKLVKIDFDEADLAKILADHYDQAGDKENAVNYYKKAIVRYINQNNYASCKEVWAKLVDAIPQEFEFFQHLRRKISKTMGDIKTATLMQELYTWYKKQQKWDTAILILKQNLEADAQDTWARKEITDCYQAKYANHSHLDEYIRSSNLTQNYRNVFEAINDFEKHIAFDKGNYVFHRNWGVGKIVKLEKDDLKIWFGEYKKDGSGAIMKNAEGKKIRVTRGMKLSMAVTALQPLSNNHIWVLKANDKDRQLAKKIKDDKEWALETIIRSFDNCCDFKRIKAELVPSILTAGEWTSWNTSAKKILETNPKFGVNQNDISMYTVRDGNITPEEKLSNEFKAQKQFFARIDILMKFFESDLTDVSSDLFAEMYSYFTGYLKNITKVTEQVLASYLVVKYISNVKKSLDFPVKETFAEIYSKIENPRQIYTLLKDTKNTHLKKDFLMYIKMMLPDWNVQYINLFPTVLDGKLISDLIEAGHTADVQNLVRTSFENCKDYRETVIYFFKECQGEKWFQEAGVTYEKQLIALINIIEITFREINNHVDSTENKKINKNATMLLFKDDAMFNYMFQNGETAVKKMYTLIDDIADIDPSYKALARNKILEKYPDFKFRVSEEKTVQPKGMTVTAKKLAEKKAEAEKIQNEDLPANAKDVAEARAKGDLKENAEYKAAREQQHYLQLTLSKLQEELSRAVVFDPTTSTTAVVSFATVVTLVNNETSAEETYTILGPWESDPDNNIISYMSPFGNAILDKKVGTKVEFTINEHNYNYTIKDIQKAKDF